MNTREMSGPETLAAHNAMRVVFAKWNPDKESLFDLSARLNAAAARAMHDIKNARRD